MSANEGNPSRSGHLGVIEMVDMDTNDITTIVLYPTAGVDG